MKIAVCISLIPELKNTPHVLTSNFEDTCKVISNYGYNGIELFPKSGKDISVSKILDITQQNNLEVCALGTGAGKGLFGLTLTSPDKEIRRKGVDYISEIIKVASKLNAMVIIGSMQGSVDGSIGRVQSTKWFIECINELSRIADEYNVTLVFEPINRYESNFINSLQQGFDVIKDAESNKIMLLADLFHMNIEESSMKNAIINTASKIGHVHFADSNRLFPGLGHSDFSGIFQVLQQIHFNGYVSVEAFVADIHTDLKYAIEIYNTFSSKAS